MSDRNFYQQLRSILETESVVVATIVKVIGSAPREVGAKMAVCADGSIIGTIGGGAGEGKVIDEALKVLETGTKQLVEIDLTGAPGKDIQGVCGGKVQVWLAKWQGIDAIALSEKILTLFKSGQSGRLITPLEKDTRPYLIGENLSSSRYGGVVDWPHIRESPLQFTFIHRNNSTTPHLTDYRWWSCSFIFGSNCQFCWV
jgi:xanthine dehydrogenase accessory factor